MAAAAAEEERRSCRINRLCRNNDNENNEAASERRRPLPVPASAVEANTKKATQFRRHPKEKPDVIFGAVTDSCAPWQLVNKTIHWRAGNYRADLTGLLTPLKGCDSATPLPGQHSKSSGE